MHRFTEILYSLIFAALAGVISSACLLGFIRIYEPLPALLLTVVLSALFWWLYQRSAPEWWQSICSASAVDAQGPLWLASLWAGWGLLLLVFGVRLAFWPYSELAQNIPVDLLDYHFIKTLDLVQSGSIWNLAIPYGQYPVGYESLPAFGVLMGGSLSLLGPIHVLLLIFLVLNIVLLLKRATSLPEPILLLAAVLVFFIPDYYSQALTVGKNDLFLSATVLAAVLHSPASLKRGDHAAHPVGLALAVLLSIGTKASAHVVLVFLWLLVFVEWFLQWRSGALSLGRVVGLAVLCGAIMFPAGLWVLRNVIIMGRFFSPEVSAFFAGSIAANLGNPSLYTGGAESLLLVVASAAVILLLLLLAFIGRWRSGVALLLMWMAFFIAPLGAFHISAPQVLHIEWRYTTHSFLYAFVILVMLVQGPILRLIRYVEARPALRLGISAGLFGLPLVVLLILGPGDLLGRNDTNGRVLSDPYADPIGVDGYWSVYDYVQQEIRGSVIYYDWAQAFYLYDRPDLTNTIAAPNIYPLGLPDLIELPPADYVVIGRMREFILPSIQAVLDAGEWEIVYDDGEGIVYRRVR